MSVLLSNSEIEALHGSSEFLYKLYIHALRRYMDYATGIVGIKRRISYQSLREEMYVEPERGVDRSETGSPSKSKIRRSLERLEKLGLLVKLKNKEHIIFQCVLAQRDKTIQNKAGTKPAQQGDTQADTVKNKRHIDISKLVEDEIEKADTEGDIPSTLQADTPPLSGKEKENTIVFSKKKTRLPDNFSVTDQHLILARQNEWPNPHHEIDAFKDYHLSKGSLFSDWDRAFYTWLRNAKKFKDKGKLNGQNNEYRGTKQNSMSRAIDNILNSPTRARS